MRNMIKYATRYFPFAILAFTAAFLYIAYALTNTVFFLLLSSFLFGVSTILPGLAYFNLKNLTIKRELCSLTTAGEEINVVFIVKNSGFYPCFFILISDPLSDSCKDGKAVSAEIRFIPPRSELRVNAVFRPTSRGVKTLNKITVQSYFPFLLYFYERNFSASDALTILPRPRYFSEIPFLSANSNKRRKQNFRSPLQSAEFKGLREHIPSDGLRLVHWAKSAAYGKLLTKEFASGENIAAAILIDGSDFASSLKTEDSPFEEMISAAAGIINYCGKNDMKAALIEPTGNAGTMSLTSGSPGELLRTLALMEPGKKPGLFPLKQMKKRYISSAFILTANPYANFKMLKKELAGSKIDASIVVFNAVSYGLVKKDKELYSKKILELKNQSAFIYSKGEEIKYLFKNNG